MDNPPGPPTHADRPPEVADGVYMLGTKWVHFYLVEEDGQFLLVDAGYCGYWDQLATAIETLGATVAAIQAVMVTHHHVDHAGVAEQLRSTVDARVFVGQGDRARVEGKQPSRPPKGFYRETWRPSMIAYLMHTVRVGGAKYRPVSDVEVLSEDQTLDLPGRPRVIHTPGHTTGHYSLCLADRGVLFSGDALVNFDYAAGRRGLGQHRFNEDRARATASLQCLDSVDADIVLFAHGEPWTDGLGKALEIVREGGASMK